MMGPIIRIQKELARMLNTHTMSDEEILDSLIEFINKMSPYEVVIQQTRSFVRNKKTLKEIEL